MNKALTAQKLARELLVQAEKNEPQITEDLKSIAKTVSAEMAGLENRLKSEKSLVRKLIDRANFNAEPVYETAEQLNDALRFTFLLPFETYAAQFRQTIKELENLGYEVSERLIWNAWQTAGKRFDRGYRGINITVISSQSQKFELQFHTAESLALKNKTHFLYRKLRDRKTSRERKSEIIEKLRKMSENVKRPEGV
jgi:hypothetical protein